MSSLYVYTASFHNEQTSSATVLTVVGSSVHAVPNVRSIKDVTPEQAALHAVVYGFEKLASIAGGAPTLKNADILVPTQELAERLNALKSKPLLGENRELLGQIAAWKDKLAATFYSTIADLPESSLAARSAKGWSVGYRN